MNSYYIRFICNFLSVEDLLKLRLLNKQVKVMIESLGVWKDYFNYFLDENIDPFKEYITIVMKSRKTNDDDRKIFYRNTIYLRENGSPEVYRIETIDRIVSINKNYSDNFLFDIILIANDKRIYQGHFYHLNNLDKFNFI